VFAKFEEFQEAQNVKFCDEKDVGEVAGTSENYDGKYPGSRSI